MKLLCTLLLSSILLFHSCKSECNETDTSIKSIMKGWYLKKIYFPENMEILSVKPIRYPENIVQSLKVKKKFTVVHFFTADCDKCVNELKMILSRLKTIAQNDNVDFVFIASAPTKLYVMDAIKKVNFPYPVYYEKEYFSFKSMNKLVLLDDIYNTMLLDENQNVILFGAFYANDKARSLYSKAIKCNL